MELALLGLSTYVASVAGRVKISTVAPLSNVINRSHYRIGSIRLSRKRIHALNAERVH
jgi:hypothetical protein